MTDEARGILKGYERICDCGFTDAERERMTAGLSSCPVEDVSAQERYCDGCEQWTPPASDNARWCSRCGDAYDDDDIAAEVDELLRQYERAVAAVVEQGDSNLSATTKERAVYRNIVRGRLLPRHRLWRDTTSS